MTININGFNSTQGNPAKGKDKVQGTSNESSASTGTSAKADSTDQVKLSPEAKTLQQLETQLAGFPEVHPEKVELIRKALREGSYQVDPTRLAAKIANFELDI
jgi:negative regulator of flagellin synthesis FlgM|tara:strand:+ start:5301 stop:5609 length:309 start_codon:yes stop_codon:yes gene_type:complete